MFPAHRHHHAGFDQVAFDVTHGVQIALALLHEEQMRKVDSNVPRVPPQTTGFFGTNTLCGYVLRFGGSFMHDSPGRSYGLDLSYSFK